LPTLRDSSLSLHDALPISVDRRFKRVERVEHGQKQRDGPFAGKPRNGLHLRLQNIVACQEQANSTQTETRIAVEGDVGIRRTFRSEEHTSELQSRENLVCR